MRIAVLGSSGVLGRHVLDVATARGHDVAAGSRATGVDLVTGEGLDALLDGAAVAIDATNVPTVRRAPARRFFEATAKRLQAAARRQGVASVVVVSIVGIDRVRQLGYYDGKLTQERHHLDGPVDATVLRATQFHEFPSQVLERSRVGPVALVPSITVQTVAARAAAEALVDAAEAPPMRGFAAEVAGPGPPARLPALAAATLAAHGQRARVVGLPLVGKAGRAIRDGALLPAPDARLLGPDFDSWLAAGAGETP